MNTEIKALTWTFPGYVQEYVAQLRSLSTDLRAADLRAADLEAELNRLEDALGAKDADLAGLQKVGPGKSTPPQ